MAVPMATRPLYHEDSYQTTCDATVLAVEGTALALDRTVLFPGGGGQMADRGALVYGQTRLPLAGLRKEGEIIWHTVEAPASALPEVGATVRAEVEWDFRYRMMRTHTALHLLCGIIFRDFGAQVTGGQMYPDRARMDFSLEVVTPSLAHDLEARVNDAVVANHPVKVYTLPRAEALEIPDLIRTKINLLPPEIATIRIVEIVGVDLQADGGTHVRETREVVGIRVLKTENKGRQNKRMELVLVDGEQV